METKLLKRLGESSQIITSEEGLIFRAILNPDLTADDARKIVKEEFGFKYIDWSPFGFAIKYPSQSYTHYLFPLDLIEDPKEKEKIDVIEFFNSGKIPIPRVPNKHHKLNIDLTRFPIDIVPEFNSPFGGSGKRNKFIQKYIAEKAPILYVGLALLPMEDFPGLPEINVEKIPIPLFRDAMIRALQKPSPSGFFKRLHKLGILEHLLPELHENIGVTQDPEYHTDDVFTHSLKTLDAIEQERLYFPIMVSNSLKLAALFHDIGKARTRKEIDQK